MIERIRPSSGLLKTLVALATEYLLPDGARLLAVNVHCLNFERWGTLKLRSQLTVLQARLAKHTEPLLLVGDFNT